jgi:hypothetical protein
MGQVTRHEREVVRGACAHGAEFVTPSLCAENVHMNHVSVSSHESCLGVIT